MVNRTVILRFVFALTMLCLLSTRTTTGQTPSSERKEGVEVKSRSAPAVVRIETGRDFGTGFFFRPEGWLLTNYHVVKDAPIDTKTGRQFVRLTYGALDDAGLIQAKSEPLWASVYRLDRRADLALLLLDAMPMGQTTVPFIPLAKSSPQDGESCFAVGMPVAGMKWDLRDGKVSSQGLYPNNVALELDSNLQLSAGRRERLLRMIAPEGPLKMIVTTCGINPGDSGGPILNTDGELLAITKAIPKTTREGINIDKFSYHIHLDEVRSFVETLPNKPEHLPPYSVPRSPKITTMQSKKSQAIIYEFSNVEENCLTTYIDIDHSSLKLSEEERTSAFDAPENELWKQLGIEWAILKDSNKPTVHYFDLDQDGKFEVVYQNAFDDGDEPKRFLRRESKWELGICTRDFLGTVQFATTEVQEKFNVLKDELPPLYTK